MNKTVASLSSRRLLLTLGATVAFAATSFGQATITTAAGQGADTYLPNDANRGPTHVGGLEGAVNQRVYWDVRSRLTMLRFDVSPFTAESLTDATVSLDFTASNRTRTWTVWGLTDESLDAWDEAATNYNNAPAFESAPLGQYAFDTSAWTELGTWNINAATGAQTSDPVALNLDTFLTGNTNGLATLLFVNSTDTNADWWMRSKEGAVDAGFAPTLNLPDAQVIPEPSTYAAIFGALALVGTCYIRRRKNS